MPLARSGSTAERWSPESAGQQYCCDAFFDGGKFVQINAYSGYGPRPEKKVVARRVDCGVVARLVVEHRLGDWEAADLAHQLTSDLVRKAYRL